MSVLVHLCRRCKHPVGWHEPREAGYTRCGCCRAQRADPDPEPVLHDTRSWRGEPEPLWAPGVTRNAGTMHAAPTCGCDRCRDRYRVHQDGAAT